MGRRFEVIARDGAGAELPAVVRGADGAVLRLAYEVGEGAPPTRVGTIDGRPVYASLVDAWGADRTATIARTPAWLVLDGASGDEEPLDEVGFTLGPERGGGLFDRTASDGAHEHDTTATAGRVLRPEFSRMAVLARVAAWKDSEEASHALPPDAVRALRRAWSEETLDPLPVLAPLPVEGGAGLRAPTVHDAPTVATPDPAPRAREARGIGQRVVVLGLSGLGLLLWGIARCG